MRSEKEPLTAEQLRAPLLHILSKCIGWTSTTTIQCQLDTDTPRAAVGLMLQSLLDEKLVEHKRDKASDMWMRSTSSERPEMGPVTARDSQVAEAPSRTMKVADLVFTTLCAAAKDGATIGQLATRTGASIGNIHNALSNLRKSGDAVTQKIGPGRDRHFAKGFEPEPGKPANSAVMFAGKVMPLASASSAEQQAIPSNAAAARFARWSTGELIIACDDQQIELPRADVDALLEFLGAASARAAA